MIFAPTRESLALAMVPKTTTKVPVPNVVVWNTWTKQV